jgi:hypothetical protein
MRTVVCRVIFRALFICLGKAHIVFFSISVMSI